MQLCRSLTNALLATTGQPHRRYLRQPPDLQLHLCVTFQLYSPADLCACPMNLNNPMFFFLPPTGHKSTWEQTCGGYPNVCYEEEYIFGPDADFLFGPCIFTKRCGTQRGDASRRICP